MNVIYVGELRKIMIKKNIITFQSYICNKNTISWKLSGNPRKNSLDI